jgi:hypothetical protein
LLAKNRVIGFDAGNHNNSDVILNLGARGDLTDLSSQEIFRIDGMCMLIIIYKGLR